MENKLKENLLKLEELQRQVASIKAMIRDQVLNDPEYNRIQKDIEDLNSKKKKIISRINSENKADIETIEKISGEIKMERQVISDLALSALIRKEDTRVTDKNGMILAPVISVKFKKTGDYKKPEEDKQ